MPKPRDEFLLMFGEHVRALRLEQNLSQEELAHLADMDRTYLGGIERGERNLSLKNVKRLADALGIAPKDLFDYDV